MAAKAAMAVTAIELPMVLAAPLNGVIGELVGLLGETLCTLISCGYVLETRADALPSG